MSAPKATPTRAAAAFYGRRYDRTMPFYGQDANPTQTFAGQRLNVPVQPGLLRFDDINDRNAPWTWSKAHTLMGDKNDRKKYAPHEDPLQSEDRIPVMKGWDQLANAYALESMASEMNALDPTDPVQAAKMVAFAREIVKGKKHAYEEEFHDEFVHRFREWLRGNGSEAEYREAGMLSYVGPDSKRNKNMPISDHPTVIAYLSQWQNRVIDYNREKTKMKLRLGRRGPYGEAASLDDLWKYFKFGVYAVESTDDLGVFDGPIKDDNDKKPNVVPGPAGSSSVQATTPKDNTRVPFKIIPLEPTSDERLHNTITSSEPDIKPIITTKIITPETPPDAPAPPQPKITATIRIPTAPVADQEQLQARLEALREPPVDHAGQQLQARLEKLKEPDNQHKWTELQQRLDNLKKHEPNMEEKMVEPPAPILPNVPVAEPPPPDDSADKELEEKAARLKKKAPKPKLPPMPTVPKEPPSDPDALAKEHIARLGERVVDATNSANQKVTQLTEQLQQSLDTNAKNLEYTTTLLDRFATSIREKDGQIQHLQAELTRMAELLLQPPAQPAPAPVVQQPPPAPVVQPPPAPVVQPVEPPPAPVVVPAVQPIPQPAPVIQPVPPAPVVQQPVPQPVVQTPEPDEPKLNTFQSVEPAPAPQAAEHPQPMPVVSPNHAVRPSEAPTGSVKKLKEEPIPESQTRPTVSSTVQRMRPNPAPELTPGESQAVEWADSYGKLLQEKLALLPQAIEAASHPDATQAAMDVRDYLQRLAEELPPIISRVKETKSLSEADRKRASDLLHVPNRSRGRSATRVIIPDQQVSLRRSSSVGSGYSEQFTVPRRDTPMTSPSKRAEPEPPTPKLRAITNKPKKQHKDSKRPQEKPEKDEKKKGKK